MLYNILLAMKSHGPKEMLTAARRFSWGFNKKGKTHRPSYKFKHHMKPSVLQLSPTTQDNINRLLTKYPNNEDNIRRLSAIKQPNSNGITDVTVGDEMSWNRNVPVILKDRGAHRETRLRLPIFQYRQEIVDLINANQVIVLSGATGNQYLSPEPWLHNPLLKFAYPCLLLRFW